MTPNPSEIPITRTASVIVRHSADCKDKKRGGDWQKCDCPKSLLIYVGGEVKKQQHISCKTRSWDKAEKFRQDYLDRFDPEKMELKLLRAAKERLQVRIEDAVAAYVADMIARLGDNGSVRMARSLFGHVDRDTKAVIKNGHLFDWLDTLPAPQRPAYIGELTTPLVTAWRNAWKFGSDLTARQRWGMVRGFFEFCVGQGWFDDSPARKMKRMKAATGNRTGIFTDVQYAEILDAVYTSDPENVPAATRSAWQARLTAFIELLRWSGMALVDGVLFRPDSIDADGVLRYHRKKTGVLATVPLPAHLIALLKDVPCERDSVSKDQPFRTGAKIESDCATWARRLGEVFKLAGITEVRTPAGRVRKPHAHMLRDTCAVWNLRHGASLFTVSKMLGHANATNTSKAYAPFVVELQTASIADARAAYAKGTAKPVKGRIVKIRASAGE